MKTQVVESARTTPIEKTAPLAWHIITCEYPPKLGGVSDYTFWVASGLAAEKDEVHVWCPAHPCPTPTAGVQTHLELGEFRPSDLRRLGEQLDRFPQPRRLLVQWVPHGYGYRAMNLPFCWWLRNRAVRHKDDVQIMVHEPYLTFRADSLRQNAVALAHRLMTILLLRAASRVWMSIPSWEQRLRPYALARRIPFQWLPVPSNIPVHDRPDRVRLLHDRYTRGSGVLIGHFGTFGRPITSLLEPILRALTIEMAGETILLMGKGSQEFCRKFIQKEPGLAGRIHATGALDAEDLSLHVSACDLLIQPYPDGVSSRRGSFMVAMNHGKPAVTTKGHLTEGCWSPGVASLASVGDVQEFVKLVRRLCNHAEERVLLGNAAREFYEERFDGRHVISALRSAARPEADQTAV